MPWSETDAMNERARFVYEHDRRAEETEGRVNLSELCREFGITRECGYKWLHRYRDGGNDVRALEDRSRRPLTSPTAVEETMQDLVVEARKLKPKWGPRKLRAWMMDRFPSVAFPSASAFAAVLKRRGLIRPARRRRRGPVAGVTAPFTECDEPNCVWCIDFKGWFRMLDGEKCYPLTISDAYSRYVIRCEALLEPHGPSVMTVLDSAFREFGVPYAMRMDNGPPFASTGAGGLTSLAVWLLKLGIRLERIAPGKPQQNGRHERMHRTLKLETKPEENLRVQQRAFDLWRCEYNEERPHEALGNRPPARVYFASNRHYPRKLITPEPQAFSHAVRVEKDGFISFHRRRFFVSTALKHLYVELELVAHEQWEVRWGSILLGRIKWSQRERGLVVARRKRGEVSAMSLD
jgi:transposase InsO family protein